MISQHIGGRTVLSYSQILLDVCILQTVLSPEDMSLRHSFLSGHVVNYHSYSHNGTQVPAF